MGGRLGLQGSDHDAFVQRVAGNDLEGGTDSGRTQETGGYFMETTWIAITVNLLKEIRPKFSFYEQRLKSNSYRILREGCATAGMVKASEEACD